MIVGGDNEVINVDRESPVLDLTYEVVPRVCPNLKVVSKFGMIRVKVLKYDCLMTFVLVPPFVTELLVSSREVGLSSK